MAKRKDNESHTEEPRRSTRQKTTVGPPPPRSAKPVPKPKTTVKPKVESSVRLRDAETIEHKLETKTQELGEDDDTQTGQSFWLMKAEPESRFEKGIDVKFSIDDLASKKVPEPWDGIRNFVARNHMRSMRKGDLAFFYHSSCKVPSIVGVMEIVQEHTPDLTAQDPKAVYHDAKDTNPLNPKWSVVHVEFREKYQVPIELAELRRLAEKKDGLEHLQMLKQTRLSVSKVERGEWEYLTRWEAEKVAELAKS